MLFLISLLLYSVLQCYTAQLAINVRNQGGEVLQETISANLTADTVTLEYQNSDGTLVTQFIDFKKEVQILKALVLGEEERGQSQYQVMCFVTHIPRQDFISADAMSKLRQKNPGTIRVAENDEGVKNKTLGISLYLPETGLISKYVKSMCTEAMDFTYSSYSDMETWSSLRVILEF
ncbi:out at first protein isoform X2 [Planococcus citri]|uniref:out at first protein isoform X2 n=1 Tax=Planococcus citri TaxID=170843 RepID=UPI0031F98493